MASGDLSRAVDELAEAEALWRGDPLADFAYEDFASAAITRLSEARLAVLEERLDIELQLGRHHRVVSQLEELVATHPLREGFRGQLMLALYRAGRQADALRVFQEGRQLLGEELGLEPGPELRRLESAILAQDPSLVADTASARRHDGGRADASGYPRGADTAGRSRCGAAGSASVVRRAALRHPRRSRRGGQDPPGARGRAHCGRGVWRPAGAWSSWRRSAIPPAFPRRSLLPWACPTRTGSPRSSASRSW